MMSDDGEDKFIGEKINLSLKKNQLNFVAKSSYCWADCSSNVNIDLVIQF